MNDAGITHVKSVCNMCQCADTGIIGHVKDGVLVKVEGDPECTPTFGRQCVKGLSAPFVPYNANRVLKPRKRTNPEKGVGVDPKWQEITWEEAFDIIVPELKRVREQNPLGLMFNFFDYPTYQFAVPWAIGFGGQLYFGGATWCGWYHNTAYQYHLSFFREADYANTNYILLWGAQAGHIVDALPVHSAKSMADARARGAKVVVIDPVMTPAASLADEWVPIRPGTDSALALCFWNLLINEYELYDVDFIKGKTNGPYLIGPDELYVRDPETNKPLIWDATAGTAKPFNEVKVADTALDGEYEFNGVTVRPAFSLMKEHLKTYSPEYVSPITTVPVDTIRRVCRDFGEAARIGSTIRIQGEELPWRPAVLLSGRGPTNHRHSQHGVFAIEGLNALIGNLNMPGGTLGFSTNYERRWGCTEDADGIALSPNSTYWHFGAMDTYPAREPKKPAWYTLFDLCPVATYSDNFFPMMQALPEEERKRFGLDYDVEFFIVTHSNPTIAYVSPHEMAEAYRKIKFTLVFATELNETVEMADVVLPNAHWTERHDPMANPPFKFEAVGEHDWYWFYRRPMIDPPHPDIKHWCDTMIELADRAGFLNDVNMLYNILNELNGSEQQLDLDKRYSWVEMCDAVMQNRYGVSVDWYEQNQTQVFTQEKSLQEAFPGPFVPGRYNIYFEYWKRVRPDLERVVQELGIDDVWDLDDYTGLLDWKPCPSYEPKDGHDLFAVNYKVACHTFSHSYLNPLQLEIGHTYPWIYGLPIHTRTAAERGIKDGDEVWVESEFGYRVKAKAHVTEGIHPEVVGTAGFGGRLTHGEKKGRLVGPNWNSLISTKLDRMDKMNSSLDACVRVKVYKA
ncbi:MAG: molybdopterin-dependent oxidoreductase [Actinobacteria bacterium]|nr:molybdopterin-dependent oxidoreductase [Actinomycetota bacterium]